MKSKFSAGLDSVILRKIWLIPAILPLPDEDAGRLIKALCLFWSGEDVNLDDRQLQTIFSTIADAIEQSARKCLEKRGGNS